MKNYLLMMCVAVLGLLFIAPMAVDAQCVNCGQSVLTTVDVGQPIITSVTYSEPVVGYSTSNCASDTQDFNLPCAVQAGSAFANCRVAGGNFFGCAIEGFGVYLSCNGGLRQRARLARQTKRQTARQARQQRQSFQRRSSNLCF